MTPAERKAKLEAAKALIAEAETDEATTNVQTTTTPPVLGRTTPPTLPANPTPVPVTLVPAQTVTLPNNKVAVAPAVAAKPVAPAASVALRTPHSEQTAAGKPSLFETLMSVAKLGFGKTQKG